MYRYIKNPKKRISDRDVVIMHNELLKNNTPNNLNDFYNRLFIQNGSNYKNILQKNNSIKLEDGFGILLEEVKKYLYRVLSQDDSLNKELIMNKINQYIQRVNLLIDQYKNNTYIDMGETKLGRPYFILYEEDVVYGDSANAKLYKNLREYLLGCLEYNNNVGIKLSRKDKKVISSINILFTTYITGKCPKIINKEVFEGFTEKNYLSNYYNLVKDKNYYKMISNLTVDEKRQIASKLFSLQLSRYLNRKGKSRYSLKWK